jgi:hypothetical protein
MYQSAAGGMPGGMPSELPEEDDSNIEISR